MSSTGQASHAPIRVGLEDLKSPVSFRRHNSTDRVVSPMSESQAKNGGPDLQRSAEFKEAHNSSDA